VFVQDEPMKLRVRPPPPPRCKVPSLPSSPRFSSEQIVTEGGSCVIRQQPQQLSQSRNERRGRDWKQSKPWNGQSATQTKS
jgi:hypothetical protein